MKLFTTISWIAFFTVTVYAENNVSIKKKVNIETNSSVKAKEKGDDKKTASESKIMEKEIKKQMKREKKYAQEQSFAQGDDYDLSAHEVNKNSLPDVPVIEPEYDFDMTDVYRDDI